MMINWNSIPATYNNAMSYLEMLGKALTQIQTNTDDIENLRLDEEQLEQNTEDIAELQSDVGTLETSLANTQSDVARLENDLDRLEDTVDAIEGTFDDYYTKDEVYTKSQVYTKSEVDSRIEGVVGDLDNYYTKAESDEKYALITALANYYTKAESDQKYALVSALSNYYTKSESDGKYALLTDLANYVSTSDLTTELANYVTTSTLTSDYYDKQEVDALISTAGGGYTKEEINDIVEPMQQDINQLKGNTKVKTKYMVKGSGTISDNNLYNYNTGSVSFTYQGAYNITDARWVTIYITGDDYVNADRIDFNLEFMFGGSWIDGNGGSTTINEELNSNFTIMPKGVLSPKVTIGHTNNVMIHTRRLNQSAYHNLKPVIIQFDLNANLYTNLSKPYIRLDITPSLWYCDGTPVTYVNATNNELTSADIRIIQTSNPNINTMTAYYLDNPLPDATTLHTYYTMADADGDGSITMSDANLILQFYGATMAGTYTNNLAGWTQFLTDNNVTVATPVYPDANRNGTVELGDALLVERYAANVIAQTFADTEENWYKFSIGEL